MDILDIQDEKTSECGTNSGGAEKKDEVENGNDDMLRVAPFFVKRLHNQENYTQTKFCTINIVSCYTMAEKI